jgi:hypothetical protein
MSFIEELFYGNLDPQSRSPHFTRRVSRDVAALDELEGALTERLQGTHKRLFLKFVDAYDEFLGSADLESFTCGFRLGAAFTYDTFVEKE